MKNDILNEIVENTKKLVGFKTIKDNFSEFYSAFDFVKEELNEYIIKEIVIDNYPNLVISNTENNNLDLKPRYEIIGSEQFILSSGLT